MNVKGYVGPSRHHVLPGRLRIEIIPRGRFRKLHPDTYLSVNVRSLSTN